MQVRSLQFQAFGAFAELTSIDFDTLTQSRLFLLEGPTGAGKSTVIDAIVFALYGSVAAATGSAQRIRSDFAGPGSETFADLVFEVPGGMFRVRRTPQYERIKKNGAGTTTQQATVKLWRLTEPGWELARRSSGGSDADPAGGGAGSLDHRDLDAAGELLSTRMDEAGLQISRAVGLSREQFVQTIVLPQGEFAAFLRARPEDRTSLLQRVFQTEVYVQAQARLAERRRAVTATVGEARQGMTSAAAAFTRLRSGEAPVPEAPDEPSQVVSEARGQLALALAESQEAEQRAVAARTEELAAQTALREGTVLLEEWHRRAQARARRAELSAQSAGQRERERRLAAATRASVVQAAVTRTDAARTVHRRGLEDLRAAVSAAAAIGVLPHDDQAERTPGQWGSWADQSRDEHLAWSVALEDSETRIARLEERAGVLAVAQAEVLAARGELAAARRAWDALPRQRELAEAERDELAPLAAGLPVHERESEIARTRRGELGLLTETWEQWLTAQGQAASATSRVSAAITTERTLREQRVRGLAGEIGGRLVAGEPCPVCGSTEHPEPAKPGDDHVSADQVAVAERARGEAERQQTALVAVAIALRERAEASAARAGVPVESLGEPGALEQAVADADAQVASACQAAESASRAQALLDEATARLSQLDIDQQRLRDDLAAADTRVATRETAAASLRDRDAEDRQSIRESVLRLRADLGLGEARELPAGRSADLTRALRDAIGEARSVLAGRTAALETLAAASGAVMSAAAAVREREREQADTLAEQGFATVAEVADQVMSVQDMAEDERAIDEYTREVNRVEAELAVPQLADLPEQVVVDLAALASHRDLATARAAEAWQQSSERQARLLALSAALDTLETAARHYQEVIGDSEAALRVADLVTARSADNLRALTLSTFVLVQRFETVVEAANARLLVMSDGRYELQRSDEREKRGGRNLGLALRVVDHATAKTREPSTLSGGETFYFSLCLALGLADVVSAESGGVEFGTLFIDEGFGSLDSDTLDVVMTQITRLRDAGRVVGLVSHVEVMKQMIPERIEVRRLPSGASRLRVIA